jgi:uncharacterized protein
VTESMIQPVDPAAPVPADEPASPPEVETTGSAEPAAESVETAEPVATPAPTVTADGASSETDVDAEPQASALGSANFRTALVSTVTVDLPSQHATVVLRENESPRRHLSFAIGIPDAVALSHALRRITTPRPLTHELMTDVLVGAEVDLVAVRVVGRQGAVYFAELDVRSRAGRGVHACRPSDGLTLALLQKVQVPILVDRRLFEQAGDVAPA